MLFHAHGKRGSLPPRSQGKLFAAGPTTRIAAQVTSVQANTAICLLLGLRRLISSDEPNVEIQADER